MYEQIDEDDLQILAPAVTLRGKAREVIMKCVASAIRKRGGQVHVVLTFETAVREAANMFVSLPTPLSAYCKYAQVCERVLGDEYRPDMNLRPREVFVGKHFKVFVGFRKKQSSKGGKVDHQLAFEKKDDGDFLRVHDILEVVSEEDFETSGDSAARFEPPY